MGGRATLLGLTPTLQADLATSSPTEGGPTYPHIKEGYPAAGRSVGVGLPYTYPYPDEGPSLGLPLGRVEPTGGTSLCPKQKGTRCLRVVFFGKGFCWDTVTVLPICHLGRDCFKNSEGHGACDFLFGKGSFQQCKRPLYSRGGF